MEPGLVTLQDVAGDEGEDSVMVAAMATVMEVVEARASDEVTVDTLGTVGDMAQAYPGLTTSGTLRTSRRWMQLEDRRTFLKLRQKNFARDWTLWNRDVRQTLKMNSEGGMSCPTKMELDPPAQDLVPVEDKVVVGVVVAQEEAADVAQDRDAAWAGAQVVAARVAVRGAPVGVPETIDQSCLYESP